MKQQHYRKHQRVRFDNVFKSSIQDDEAIKAFESMFKQEVTPVKPTDEHETIPTIPRMKKDRRVKSIIKKNGSFYLVELKPGYFCTRSGGHFFTADRRDVIATHLAENIRICGCQSCLEKS